MVYNFFDKRSAKGSDINSISNWQLLDELHKPIIKKFKRIKVYLTFKDNTWGSGLADMQLISKYNKGLNFYCVYWYFY